MKSKNLVQKKDKMIRKKKTGNLKKFIGSGIWEGDLSVMREDKKLIKKIRK